MSEILRCWILALTIYGEARGESMEGKIAVAWVVRNRTHDRRWGNTYEEVALQPKQFSAFNRDDPNLLKMLRAIGEDAELFWECFAAAVAVHYNIAPDPTKGANHYHHIDIRPKWINGMIETTVIGNHKFYRG